MDSAFAILSFASYKIHPQCSSRSSQLYAVASMFFTPRSTAPPALHNTRYSGWPDSSQPLPQSAASPSRTARRVTFDTPSRTSHEDHITHIRELQFLFYVPLCSVPLERQPVHPHYGETRPSTASSAQCSNPVLCPIRDLD